VTSLARMLTVAAIALALAAGGALLTGCGDDEQNTVTDAIERLEREGEELREQAEEATKGLDDDAKKEVEEARKEAEELREKAEKEANEALEDSSY
jgi:cell division septum initiation protein DivIVA